MNSNFQNELTLRLKSISSNKEQQQQQNPELISQKKPQTTESNSTVTTTLSSASSCTSNSDLILPKPPQPSFNNTNTIKRPLDLNPSLTNIESNNKQFSLLKTTLNMTSQNDNETHSDTLGRQNRHPTNGLTPKINNGMIYGTNTYKPPILKPKPRNNIYQTMSRKMIANSESVHNQSVEPLLKETSLHTSPSTSVTDVSSNNCTPQHYTTNLVEEINKVQQTARSRSNSLSRQHQNNNNNNHHSSQGLNNNTKATTTFATSANGNSIIYSTTKINGNQEISNNAPTMRTFNANYENSTLGRKLSQKKTNGTLEEGINKISQNSAAQRTIDRRHIKNSEC